MPRQRLSCSPSSVAPPAFGSPFAPACTGGGSPRAEQPRLGGLELLHVVVVVGEEGAGGLDVARPGEPQFEAHALLGALPAQLVHLGAQRLRALGALRRLRDLALELGDARVALRERGLVVLTRLGDSIVDLGSRTAARAGILAAAHLRRRALRLLRRALVDLLRPVLQAIHLPVLPVRRAKKEPAP